LYIIIIIIIINLLRYRSIKL